MKTIIKDRKKSQPHGVKTGGSTFSNPQNNSAWKLIDAIKYRGKSNGGAKVSEHHSNFLLSGSISSGTEILRPLKNTFDFLLSIDIEDARTPE